MILHLNLKVLVLCTGNLYRSPALAWRIQQLRPEWVVLSAGTHCSKPNIDTPKRWRVLHGGWVEGHRAQKVTDEMLASADEVVCCAPVHAKVVPRPCWVCEIPDPAFQPQCEWEGIARKIAEESAALVKLIEEDQEQ